MKKIITYFVIISIFLVFTGCKNEKSYQTGQDIKITAAESQKAGGDKSSGSIEAMPSSQNKDGSLSIATNKSVELPKGYPTNLFPIYEGSFIYSAMELNGSYTLTAFSKDEVKKVMAFYEKVLENANVNMDTKTDESLTSMGTKGSYAYTMDVGKSTEKGYQTVITISLQPTK